ncbi:MAG: hypothetical protein ACRELC_03495, partial [Gemmatimonadota bacterium]
QQGLYEEATAMYERLLERDPHNARLARRLEEVRRLGPEGRRPPSESSEGRSRPIPRPETWGSDRPLVHPERAGESAGALPSAGAATGGRPDVAPTIREFLGMLLDGQGPESESGGDERLSRLRRWLRAGADAAGR